MSGSIDLESIGIAFDTSGLDRGTAALKANEAAAVSASQAADKVSEATQRQTTQTTATATALNSAQQAAQKVVQANAQLTESTNKLTIGQVYFLDKLATMASTLGKSRAEIVALQAAELGVAEQAAPMIQKFQEAEAAAHKLSLANAGVTRELAVMGGEALRGNWTRLEGSMTVLANRTGLMEMAIKALTSPLGIVFGAMAVGAGVVAALAVHFENVQHSLNTMEAQLTATGRAGMLTTGELQDLLHTVMLLPGVNREAATSTVEAFTRTQTIGKQLFGQLIGDVGDFAAATGKKVPEAAQAMAEAFANPAEGAKRLHSQLGILSETQVIVIEKMMEMGDIAGAQQALFLALHGRIQGLAVDAMSPLGRAAHEAALAWDEAMQSMGKTEAMDKVSGILVAMVNSFTWLIQNAPRLNKAISEMPIAWLTPTGPMAWLMDKFGGPSSAAKPGPAATAATAGAAGSAGGDPESARIKQMIDLVTEQNKGYKAQSQALAELSERRATLNNTLALATQEYGANSDQARQLRIELAGVNEAIARSATNKDALSGAMEALKQQAALAQDSVKAEVQHIESMYRQGAISHIDAIQQENDAQFAGLEKQRQYLEQELALAQRSVNSAREVAGIKGQLRKLDQQQNELDIDLQDKLSEADAKSWDESFKDYAKGLEQRDQTIAKIREQTLVIEQEIGGNQRSAEAVNQVALAHLREQAARLISLGLQGDTLKALLDEIAAREKLATGMDALNAKRAADAGAKKAEEAWTHTEHTIEEGLYRAIESGGGSAAKKLFADMKNWAAHLILQPLFQPIAQFGASLLNGGAASATGSFGSSLATSAAGSWLTGQLGGTGIAGIGSAIAGGYAAGATGATAFSTALGVGNAGLGASGLAEMASTGALVGSGGVAGGVSGALSAGLSAIPVAGWVALGAMALYSMFGGQGGGPKNIGSFSTDNSLYNGVRSDSTGASNDAAKTAAQSIVSAYATAAQGLGVQIGQLNAAVLTSVDDKGKGDAQTALAVQAWLDGKLVYDRNNALGGSDAYKDVGRTPEELQAAETEAAGRAVLSALKASGFTGKLADYFDSLDPLQLSSDQITAAITAATTAKQLYDTFGLLGPAFKSVSDLSVEAVNNLAKAYGDPSKFAADLQSYYTNFYSAKEQRDNAINQVTSALSAAGVGVSADQVANATVDQVRALMDQLVAMGSAGQAGALALLNLNGVIKQIIDTGKSATTLAELRDAALGLQGAGLLSNSERQSLQTSAIQSTLRAAGINVTDSQLLNATGQQIHDMVASLIQVGKLDAAKAVINVADAILQLKGAAAPTVEELHNKALGLSTPGLVTDQERQAITLSNIHSTLRDAGVDGFTDQQILHATVDQLRAVYTGFEQIGNTKAADAILDVADSVMGLQKAANNFKQAAIGYAYQGLELGVQTATDKLAAANNTLTQAQSDLVTVYQREQGPLQAIVQQETSRADALHQAALALDASNVNGLSGSSALTLARQSLGNATEDNAPGLVSDYLGVLQKQASTLLEYQRGVALGRNVILGQEAAARGKVSDAQKQLDAMEALVSPLVDLTKSVMSLDAAIRAVQTAQSGVGTAQAKLDQANFNLATWQPMPEIGTPEWDAYTQKQENDWWHDYAAEIAQVPWEDFSDPSQPWGAMYGYVPGVGGYEAHAHGGMAMGLSLVGEHGPELVDFQQPARVYTAQQTAGMFSGTGDNGALVSELAASRQETAALRSEVSALTEMFRSVTRGEPRIYTRAD